MQDLFNPTLRAIHSNEDLFDRLSDLPVVNSFLTLSAKVGLDGSRLNSKRQQLSGEVDDDNSLAFSDSFLDVFMTPFCIYVSGLKDILLWEDPFPNSVFYTQQIKLVKAKECRAFVVSFFLKLQSCLYAIRCPHEVQRFPFKVIINRKVPMIDDKVVDILHGDSGSFCHYCDVLKKEVSSLEFIDNAGVGRMPVSKTIEQCKERREWLESRQISYSDPQSKGQCHPPLSSQSDYLLAILHQELQY